jgi:chemotaxis protein methyltransferase CheR
MRDEKGASDETSLDVIREWVTTHLGIRFSQDQASVLGRRLGIVFGSGTEGQRDVAARLRRGDPLVVKQVTEAATINHTYFFREPETLDYFANQALPRMPEREPLRLWSAASSSGEEAYSVAMVSKKWLGRSGAERIRILGTDISPRRIELAERAVYENEALRSVPEEYSTLFVPHSKNESRVVPSITELCTFRRMNLTSFPWPFQKKFHAVFLRNILYYFEPPLRRVVLEEAFDSTESGGWLFVGLGESMWGTSSRWTPVGHGIFRKGSRP